MEYILHQKHSHTIGSNWLNRETCTNSHIIYDVGVNYVRMMINNYPHLSCLLSKIGSDCCNGFFLWGNK